MGLNIHKHDCVCNNNFIIFGCFFSYYRDLNTSRIDAGSGKLVPNFSYDLRKAWQRPHKEIEAHTNPAYAVALYPGVILQEVTLDTANHHYETVAEATKGASKVYYNISALRQDQHSIGETKPQDYINLH